MARGWDQFSLTVVTRAAVLWQQTWQPWQPASILTWQHNQHCPPNLAFTYPTCWPTLRSGESPSLTTHTLPFHTQSLSKENWDPCIYWHPTPTLLLPLCSPSVILILRPCNSTYSQTAQAHTAIPSSLLVSQLSNPPSKPKWKSVGLRSLSVTKWTESPGRFRIFGWHIGVWCSHQTM